MLETYREAVRHLSIEVKDGEVEALDSAIEQGTAVRVIDGGRLGFAYSTEPGMSVADVVNIARRLEVDVRPDIDRDLPSASRYPQYAFDKGGFLSLTTDQKKEKVLALEAEIKSYDKRITGTRKTAYEEEIHDIQISNSKGVDAKFSYGICCLRTTAVACDGSHSEWATEVEFAKDPKLLDVKAVAYGAAGRVVSYLGARSISSCKAACILDRHVVSEMLSHFSDAFFADAVYKRKSIFSNKMGDRIYSSLISVMDDPTLKDWYGVPCDAEGAPSQRTVVVDKGVLKAFLSDVFYAKKLGVSSTASSVRPQIMQMPKIGIRNLYILPGVLDREGLMQEMGNGLLVTDIMGLHTANKVTGDFSVGAVGFLVKNGQMDHAVKGITIAGNIHELFRRAKAVGSDLKFWHESGAPSMLLEEIAISGN